MARGYKTGGRKKGVPNKPKPYRQLICTCISKGVGEYFESGGFAKDFEQLEPRDRIIVMEKLTQYVVPKQQSQSVDINTTSQVSESLHDKLSDLAGEYNK
jgi:hypothetical protein